MPAPHALQVQDALALPLRMAFALRVPSPRSGSDIIHRPDPMSCAYARAMGTEKPGATTGAGAPVRIGPLSRHFIDPMTSAHARAMALENSGSIGSALPIHQRRACAPAKRDSPPASVPSPRRIAVRSTFRHAGDTARS